MQVVVRRIVQLVVVLLVVTFFASLLTSFLPGDPTTTIAPYSYTLNLTPVPGAHTLLARAFDAAGNSTDSPTITLQQ